MGSGTVVPRVGPALVVPLVVVMAAGWAVLALRPDHQRAIPFAAMWLAMSVSMMVPAVLRPLQRAADGSATRAWRFVAGYVLAWVLAGSPAFALIGLLDWTPSWIAFAWLVAGVYQVTPLMHRSLSTCRLVPFRMDPLRYGVRQGWRCVMSCWPLMVAVMVTAMAIPGPVLPLAALAVATAFVCWQKSPVATARAVAACGVAMVLLAAGGVVLAGAGPAHHSSGVSRS